MVGGGGDAGEAEGEEVAVARGKGLAEGELIKDLIPQEGIPPGEEMD